MDKKLRWVNTRYNMSLDCVEDLNFYFHLLEVDPNAAEFYYQFHNEASTNDPVTDWGRDRRKNRRKDMYQHCHKAPFPKETI